MPASEPLRTAKDSGICPSNSILRLPAGKRSIELLGQIPLSLAVRSGSDAGTPIVVAEPQSPQAKTYRDIAKKLMTIADIRYEDSA